MDKTQKGNRFKGRFLVIGVSCLVIVLVVWLLIQPEQERVADVTKPQIVVLVGPETDQRYADINLRIFGRIDGKAVVSPGLGGRDIEIAGDFDINLGRVDCYASNYFVTYIPAGVVKGRVVIQYRFAEPDGWTDMLRSVTKDILTSR